MVASVDAHDDAHYIASSMMATAPNALPAAQALAIAAALREQNRPAEAEQLYRAVLARNPDHVDSLHAVGVLLLQRGAPQEALALLEKASALGRESAELHNDLGMALASLGRPADAIPHFERALALKPDFATAHGNLGNALVSERRGRDAIRHLAQAIALRPGDAIAEFNLASALAHEERQADAAEHYRKAVVLKPDWIAAWCGLGQSLHLSDRSAQALTCYERALALDPASADAQNGAGLVMQALGRLQESRLAFEKAVALAPAMPSFHRSLAEIKSFDADDPQLAAMQALAARMDTLPEGQQAELHFALGKAFGDLGRDEIAFRHLLAGNAIKVRQDEYDEAAHLGMIRHIQEVFTADVLQRHRGAGDPSRVPVLIVSMPRSGSTLIEQILASHPRIFGAGELRYLARATKEFRGNAVDSFFPEVAKSLSVEQLRDFGAHYVAYLRSFAPDADRVTDKMPSNFRFVGLINMALPNARIIHARRDPMDTCISCFSHLFGKKSFTSDLGNLGRYYRAYATLMEHWRAVLPPDAMLEVQYEELVADFESQARRIVSFCGLDWDARCLDFHRTVRPVRTASVTQVREPLFATSVGRWRRYGPWLQPLIDALESGSAPTGPGESTPTRNHDAVL